jgi:glyoxylase-like metal-dependent hydrolase (beta-lactamase superfamily II)/rhodanese-related sulfurtransferase
MTNEGATQLSSEELAAKFAANEPISVLDVRDRDEFETWRLKGPSVEAVHLPHVKFLQAKVRDTVPDLFAETDLAEPVVAVCGRGEASDQVAGMLREAGIDAVNLEGGMDAWGRVYVRRKLAETRSATVYQYERPSSGCLSYLVVSGDDAVVVDPLRAFADRYVADARDLGVDLRYAIDTHVHADHVSGIRAVAEQSGARPVLPEPALERGVTFDAEFDAEFVADGDDLRVGEATLTALHAPGHTTEMTTFGVGDLLLSGDGLFLRSVPRPDLEAGTEGASDLAHTLYRTLHERLFALPNDTLVAPGHVSPATERGDDDTFAARLNAVRERLDLLDLSEDEFVETILSDVPPRPANFEEIIAINLGRESTDDDEAFELELGPNNCAIG